MEKKTINYQLFLGVLFGFLGLQLQAQQSVNPSGGEAIGTGGTVSYTIGQVDYMSYNGSNGSVSEGVQQPFEISVTSVNDAAGISLNVKAYPNPTQGDLWLTIEELDIKNLSYQIFDYNGKLVFSEPIRDNQTHISMQKYASAIYFIQIIGADSEIKIFKIIKN